MSETLKVCPPVRPCARHSPPCVTNDDVMTLGQQIDDLPLGFVSPLQTDHASSRHGKALTISECSKASKPDNLRDLGRCDKAPTT